MPSADDSGRVRAARHIGAAVAAVGAALYLVALPNDWVLDDRMFMLSNPLVRDPSRLPAVLWTDYWDFFAANGLYRPLTVLSMALQHAIAGDAVWSYRLVNAALHGLTSWLVFALLHRGLALRTWPAAMGALLYAAHPACSEAVLLVVGRADMFVAIAALGMLRLHLADYRLGGRTPRTLVPAALLLLLFGLGAKENAVAIPPLLLAVDVARGRVRRSLAVHGATFGLLIAFWYGVRTPLVGEIHDVPSLLESPLYGLPLPDRLPGIAGVLGHYLGVLVAPLHLSVDYSFDVLPARPTPGDFYLILGSVGVAASLGAFLWARRTSQLALAVGLALVWLPLIPVSNALVRIGTIFAERFLYLPAAGLAVLVAYALERRPRLQQIAAVVVLAFFLRTAIRETDWRDPLTLAARTAEGSRSARAHYWYGLGLHTAGQAAAAEAEYRRAVAIWPDYYHALMDLAGLLLEQNRPGEAEIEFRRAIAAGAMEARPFVSVGQLCLADGRNAEAAAAFARATSVEPDGYAGWYGRGVTFLRVGDVARARIGLRKALRRMPGDALSRLALARITLYGDGAAAEAAAALETIVADAPQLTPAWADLGESYARLGRRADAVKALERAASLAPTNEGYRNRLTQLRGPD